MDQHELRHQLLGVNGIGRETADSILLYAVEKPIFVIDAYTRRLLSRLGFAVPDDYDQIQRMFQSSLERSVPLYNEYHALIVRHCKDHCKKKPLCSQCPFEDICTFISE